MFKGNVSVYLIAFLVFWLTVGGLIFLQQVLTRKRTRVLERLRRLKTASRHEEGEDILTRPFLERTLGILAQWLVLNISQATPNKVKEKLEDKLEKAGNPKSLKASDLLALQGILGLVSLGAGWLLLAKLDYSPGMKLLLNINLTVLAVYLPWFALAKMATQRQREIRRSLPDIMDLLVICVEAGLAFDMALMKVVEKFKGTVAVEFQKALKEMQLGKPRKDALKNMARRIDLTELSSLVNAIIQSDQLGVGLGGVLRLQADLIREKRQQFIEEQAMKAPIKMLFPLIFFIFPSIFIVILGPAVLNILKMLGGD